MVEAAVMAGQEYQFDSIKGKVETIIDTVVHQKCNDI